MTFGTLLALCSRSPLCGHSLRARIQGSVELTDRGTKLPFTAAAPMSACGLAAMQARPPTEFIMLRCRPYL